MIKFNITEHNEVGYLFFESTPNPILRISSTKPLDVGYIEAPKLVCYMVIFKLINKLEIMDFEFENHTFTFTPQDFERVEELYEIYASIFNSRSQYLVILYEDSDGYPQYRFEFDFTLKNKIINEFRNEKERLDLIQVACGVIIDSISIRKFGGHIEIINRLSPLPVPS
ncbi:hypothetical protein VSAK1_26080 [Vibrio mediterranei AK1]|uniref:hypothetical protein n=1 Tax=Vibrio mediterranei TaxID=689 RepID=UPI0001541CFE|nr:hypothetical protein [Vibrio mediterranei]EDL53710.1 hypothetical protein VSAK1_26080 [Vibrio mediterranei AK1]